MTITNPALDPKKSIIVKAPAGSGKTELLVQRYLNLLAEASEDPCQIVAITFTRKAAAEMRRRLHEELNRESAPTEKHKIVTYRLAQKVLAKAKKEQWRRERIVTKDNVTTIDSFCHTLVTLDPLKAGFWTTPDILLDEETNQLYMQAAKEAMATMKDDKEDIQGLMSLLYLHSNSPFKLKSAIASILKNRTAVLPIINSKSVKPISQLKLLVGELKGRLIDLAPIQILQQITQILNDNLEYCSSPPFNIPDKDTDWRNCPLDEWQNLAKILTTKEQKVRKPAGLSKKQGFIAKTPTKKEMHDILKKLQTKNEWVQYLASCTQWTENYTQQELELAQASQKLIQLAAAHLLQIFKRENKCDHSHIMLSAIAVIGQEHSPSLLAERMGYRLRHLLVDEFQDTSYGQLQLLQAITSWWDTSTFNSLFLVGDPMQSIYSFRQADVRIFNRLWQEERLGQIPLNKITLENNYRSQSSIVEWFNKSFLQIFLPKADNLINAVSYTRTQPQLAAHETILPSFKTPQGYEDSSHVYHLGIIHHNKISLSQQQIFGPIIEQLQKITTQEPTAKIAILVRNRNHIEGIIPLLQKSKLNFDADNISYAGANSLITDAFTLFRALYDTKDELAWYALLRAPWCGLCLKDMLSLANSEKDTWQLLLNIAHKDSETSISQDGVTRIKHLVNSIAPIMEQRRRKNWPDLVYRAWQLLGKKLLIKNEREILELELFFDLLRKQVSQGNNFNLELMHEHLKKLSLKIESKAPIQIMTVHRAKGLEFDYVFLASLHRGSGNKSKQDNLFNVANFVIGGSKSPKPKQQEITLMAINSPGSNKDDEPVYRMIKSIIIKQQYQEACRLFYVACTRARKGLYLHYILKYKLKDDEKDLIEELQNDLTETLKNSIMPSIQTAIYSPKNDSFISLIEKQVRNKIANLIFYKKRNDEDNEDNKKDHTTQIKRISSAYLDKHHAKDNYQYDNLKQKTLGTTAPFKSWNPPFERCKGIVIHLLMESLANNVNKIIKQDSKDLLLQKEIKKWHPLLREKGLNKEEVTEINNTAKSVLDFCLSDKRAHWILQAKGLNEWKLARKDENPIRIDRYFESDGIKWIIDYKTSQDGKFNEEELSKYHKQLMKYAAAVNKLYPEEKNIPIKVAIYCPQNGFWREWNT